MPRNVFILHLLVRQAFIFPKLSCSFRSSSGFEIATQYFFSTHIFSIARATTLPFSKPAQMQKPAGAKQDSAYS